MKVMKWPLEAHRHAPSMGTKTGTKKAEIAGDPGVVLTVGTVDRGFGAVVDGEDDLGVVLRSL